MRKVIEILRDKYAKSKSEKYEEFIEKLTSFKVDKSEDGEDVWTKFENLVTEASVIDLKGNLNYFLASLLVKKSSEGGFIGSVDKRELQKVIEGSTEGTSVENVKESFKKMKIEGQRDNNADGTKSYFASNEGRSKYEQWKS